MGAQPSFIADCAHCGRKFERLNPRRIYCKPGCKDMAWQKRHPEKRREIDRRISERQKADRRALLTDRECDGCGTVFTPSRKDQVHCRKGCRAYRRRWSLQQRYGITEGDYDTLVITQGGRCAICGDKPTTGLVVDHNHDTGEVRGLLCRRCNLGIGHLLDDPTRAANAALYLIARS